MSKYNHMKKLRKMGIRQSQKDTMFELRNNMLTRLYNITWAISRLQSTVEG